MTHKVCVIAKNRNPASHRGHLQKPFGDELGSVRHPACLSSVKSPCLSLEIGKMLLLPWVRSILWDREDTAIAMGPFHSPYKLLSGLSRDAVGEATLHQPAPPPRTQMSFL